MSLRKRLRAIVLGCAIALPLAALPAVAEQITGAGSTFVYPILAKWSEAYSKEHNVQINYQSIGSGGGIAQIKAGTVTFGASDKPLDATELQQAGLAQFPSVIGGIVPVVNLPDIKPGQLHFTGALLADIYLGKVKKWNDPAIASLNQGLRLPDLAITVVHRSDGSGTTFTWVDYLSKVSADWKSKVGEGTSVGWPTGVGGKGNEGVAAYVGRIKGSIGYLEYAYVLQNKMTYGMVQNQAGQFVIPSSASFQAAAAGADWAHARDFDLIITNAPGPQAYPIAATVFILMYKTPRDPAASKEALAFFSWAFEKGQSLAEQLDYVPLPDQLVKQIEAYWQNEIH
jgi:phosphate transport system substrate-binding protein